MHAVLASHLRCKIEMEVDLIMYESTDLKLDTIQEGLPETIRAGGKASSACW